MVSVTNVGVVHPLVAFKNEQAALVWEMLTDHAGRRVQRAAHATHSWPGQKHQLCSEDETANQAAAIELKLDYENFMWLCNQHCSKFWEAIKARSCFHFASTQQLVDVLKEVDWRVNDPQVQM